MKKQMLNTALNNFVKVKMRLKIITYFFCWVFYNTVYYQVSRRWIMLPTPPLLPSYYQDKYWYCLVFNTPL